MTNWNARIVVLVPVVHDEVVGGVEGRHDDCNDDGASAQLSIYARARTWEGARAGINVNRVSRYVAFESQLKRRKRASLSLSLSLAPSATSNFISNKNAKDARCV